MKDANTKIIIFGGGQIGTACGKFISDLYPQILYPQVSFEIWDKLSPNPAYAFDFDKITIELLVIQLVAARATHVIVALPFNYNTHIAAAAVLANCHYIDFTEDDTVADAVQTIYKNSGLTCAVKCGLAPGFINYLGHKLVNDIIGPNTFRGGTCTDLMISVGALPRNVNGSGADLYNLSWSVDGLVNEFTRPCRVRVNGIETTLTPLTGLETVYADGVHYEAMYTSGGIGSLVKELKHVRNVAYKTLRYPGHYKYVQGTVARWGGNFESIKAEFLKTFPFNTDDVIVIYAEAKGFNADNTYVRKSYSAHFVGIDGLSGIQSTTAGSAIAILEMMLNNQISGIVNHADISLDRFMETKSASASYIKRK